MKRLAGLLLITITCTQGCSSVSTKNTPQSVFDLKEVLNTSNIASVRIIPPNQEILGQWKCLISKKTQTPEQTFTITAQSIDNIAHRWVSEITGTYSIENHKTGQRGYVKFHQNQELSYSVFDLDDKRDLVASYTQLNGKVIESSPNHLGSYLREQYLNTLHENQSIIAQKLVQTLKVSNILTLSDTQLVFRDRAHNAQELANATLTQCKKPLNE